MLNRVILLGRLVKDPEIKHTGEGNAVTTFQIAVDRNYVKKGEERKADFFSVVAWRKTAEFVVKYFQKGSLIAVEGQLQSRTYQKKDGSTQYVFEINADNVSFAGERRNKTPRTPNIQSAPNTQSAVDDDLSFEDDSLPF